MRDEFLQMMESFGISAHGNPLLVAVSGGMDSMVLATLLHDNGFPMAVAHCNYQLREAESDKDEELVRTWCSARKIPFYCQKVETQKQVETSGDSIQMVARTARYQFFEELMEKYDFQATAVAHHANDRVESLLMNVLRGTGLRGLQGMPSQRGHIIRPLIRFSKERIIAYAKENQVLYREDASNLQTYYQRNWVRLRLLPMLQQKDAHVFKLLQELCERVENDLPAYHRFIEEILAKIRTEEGGFSIAAIQSSGIPFTLLKELLSSRGFSSDQVFEVMGMMQSHSGTLVCSATHRILKDRNQLFLSELELSERIPHLRFEVLERAQITSLLTPLHIVYVDACAVGIPETVQLGLVDPNELHFKVRKWQRGDRFKPLGMKGWKKISDFFIDTKTSVPEKEHAWILTYEEEIVWVVGMRLDERYKVGATTQIVLKITARL